MKYRHAQLAILLKRKPITVRAPHGINFRHDSFIILYLNGVPAK
jgi:hypothetical protein